MQNDKIYMGTIVKCIEYNQDTETCGTLKVCKENALLVRTRNGFYVDIEGLNLLEIAYLYFENKEKIRPGTKFMYASYYATYEGENFVLDNTIRPYISCNERKKSTSLVKLKLRSNEIIEQQLNMMMD